MDLMTCLKQGGIPAHATAMNLQWLMAKNTELANAWPKPNVHALWRLRWAYTYHDLVVTMTSQPRTS